MIALSGQLHPRSAKILPGNPTAAGVLTALEIATVLTLREGRSRAHASAMDNLDARPHRHAIISWYVPSSTPRRRESSDSQRSVRPSISRCRCPVEMTVYFILTTRRINAQNIRAVCPISERERHVTPAHQHGLPRRSDNAFAPSPSPAYCIRLHLAQLTRVAAFIS